MKVLKIVDHSLSEVSLVEQSSGHEKPMEAYLRRRGCGKGIWSSEGKWNLEGEGLVARVEISLFRGKQLRTPPPGLILGAG